MTEFIFADGHRERLKKVFRDDPNFPNETIIPDEGSELALLAIAWMKVEGVLDVVVQEISGQTFLAENFNTFSRDLKETTTQVELELENVWEFIAIVVQYRSFLMTIKFNLKATDEFLEVIENDVPAISDATGKLMTELIEYTIEIEELLKEKTSNFEKVRSGAMNKFRVFLRKF